MTNLNINTGFAINKAQAAVKSWEQALESQIKARDAEGIEFCRKSLEASKRNLDVVRKDIKENWTTYL